MTGTELGSVLSRIATNRPFPHSCKQRHQLEVQLDKKQWFVWNCPPEPRPHFFIFAHWSVMWERSIAAIFWKNSSPVIKHNPFQLACLNSALWAKWGKCGIYAGYVQWKRCLQVASYGKHGKAFARENSQQKCGWRLSKGFQLSFLISESRVLLEKNWTESHSREVCHCDTDLKSTAKKGKSIQSESKATKKPAVI